MKANELMIGDWVRMRLSFGRTWFADKVGCINLNNEIEYEPIPLTADILWKNFPDPDIVEWYPNSAQTEYHIHIESSDITIDGLVKYVHELQRALRLCGLEDLANNFQL